VRRRLDAELTVYRYEPATAPTGVYVVAPGLHFDGPDDPRMDRFCRVLAAAGLLVVAPLVRCYRTLEVRADAADDVMAACRHACELARARGLGRPALFSISFGSTPALEAAASSELRDALGGLVIFGGFYDFAAVIRFAVSGRAFDDEGRSLTLPHDPLNAPAVFINLLPHLEGDRRTRERLQGAWLRLARRTWGRHELRPRARRLPIAEAIAAELPRALRELFLVGAGLAPGGAALVEEGLARSRGAFAFTDAAPRLARLRAPLVVAHGRDDDVIPFVEAFRLARALPAGARVRLHLTGAYGHTGAMLPAARALTGEAASMMALVRALLAAPHEEL
jgi:pimeloyl-ACP methyl ester carboxylesterase